MKTRAFTMEDIIADPEKYGAPTFEQFKMMREKFMGRYDDQMVALSQGPLMGRKDLCKIRYQINGIELPNEEAVEKALSDYNHTLADIDLDKQNSRLKKSIQMVPLGGGKFDVVVNFMPETA